MKMSEIVEKYGAFYVTYERGEPICEDIMMYSGKDIFFDTKEDAEDYIEKHLDHEFCQGYASKMTVYEGSGILYSEVLKIEKEQKEKRKKKKNAK